MTLPSLMLTSAVMTPKTYLMTAGSLPCIETCHNMGPAIYKTWANFRTLVDKAGARTRGCAAGS